MHVGAGAFNCQEMAELGDTGLEPRTVNPCSDSTLRESADRSAAESGAVDVQSSDPDPDLAAVVEAWPTLPKAVKAGVMAIVRACDTDRGDRRDGDDEAS